jgi:hypothetical protein
VIGAARVLQRRAINARPGRMERQLWQWLQRRISTSAAVRAGLLAFGLPLQITPAHTGSRLHHDGEATWVDGPAGRFVLTVGDDVAESVVERLSRPHASPAIGTATTERASA